jgi:hypothetical protein
MQLTVPGPILLQIGTLAVRQSHVEGELTLFIHELLGLDEQRAELVTHRLGVWALADLLGDLLMSGLGENDSRTQRFSALRRELANLVPERNAAIHSMWSFGGTFDATSATRIQMKRDKRSGTVTRQATQVTQSELQEVADRLEALQWEISTLRVSVYHERQANQDHGIA